MNRNLNTYSSHISDFSHHLQGFKGLTLLPEVSLPRVGRRHGKIQACPEWRNLTCCDKTGHRSQDSNSLWGLGESPSSISHRFFLCAASPFQDKRRPLAISRREKREKMGFKNTEFNATYRGPSHPFLQQILTMQPKLH